MNIKVWIKVNAADKALLSLRNEIISLFDNDDVILDIGCGSGDLLFKASEKIKKGLGIDLDIDMIQYAQKRCKIESIQNLSFKAINALELETKPYDIATCTLCIHELDENIACDVLEFMAKNSKKMIIADFIEPKGLFAKASIEFDEMISGHYKKFRRYRQLGGMPTYIKKCNLKIDKVIKSEIDGIAIWVLSKEENYIINQDR